MLLASAIFLLSAPAYAQPEQEVPPSMMERLWEPVPPPEQEWITPETKQPESMKDSAARTEQGKGRVSPEGIDYSPAPDQPPPVRAIHMGLQKKTPEEPMQVVDAADPPPKGNFAPLRQMDTASVDQIIDPLRIRLRDRRIVQLAGLDIPGFNLDDPGDTAVAARYYLEKLLANRQVRLYQTKDPGKGRTNRMGFVLGHLAVTGESETWVQGALLAEGLARVQPSARNTEMAAQMIALEDKARERKKGLWADSRYTMLTPETASQGLNDWAVVEGRVRAAAMNQNTLYLNFGDDWRKDFTVVVTPGVRRQFVKNKIDPLKLAGKKVRVRGWLEDYNGPSLELADAAWIEILPAGNATPGSVSDAPESTIPEEN